MSRSRKKNPYIKICGTRPGVQKSWKKQCNKRMRALPIDTDMPQHALYHRVSGSLWSSPSDGKWRVEGDDKVWRK